MAEELQLLYVPVPNEGCGAELARTLLAEKRIACANLLPPHRSFYRWEGKFCDESEQLLLLKSSADQLEALSQRIEELHPYDCPCVLQLPVQANELFANWVSGELKA